jgi:hypothetical protein
MNGRETARFGTRIAPHSRSTEDSRGTVPTPDELANHVLQTWRTEILIEPVLKIHRTIALTTRPSTDSGILRVKSLLG